MSHHRHFRFVSALIAPSALFGVLSLLQACGNKDEVPDDDEGSSSGGNADGSGGEGTTGGSDSGGQTGSGADSGSGGMNPAGGNSSGGNDASGRATSGGMGGMGGSETSSGGESSGGSPPVEPEPTHFLPASGQTQCTYTDGGWAWDASCSQTYLADSTSYPLGQDAHNQDKYSAIDLVASDAGLSVTDNVTGLVWERCGSGQTLADNACGGTITTYNHAAAKTYCDNLSIGDRTWRLPTAVEFNSILNYGTFDPILDTSLFSGTVQFAKYWTATEVGEKAFAQWMYGGDMTLYDLTTAHPVRCVSGDSWTPDLEKTTSGTVLDKKTLLEITACPLKFPDGEEDITVGTEADCSDSNASSGWAASILACESLDYAGHQDWRLLSIRDLGYIQDYTTPGILNPSYFAGVADSDVTILVSSSGPNNASGSAALGAQPELIRANAGKSNSSRTYCIRGSEIKETD